MTRDEIVAALVAWLEAERVRYLGLLAHSGVLPTRAIPELVALEPEEGRIEYHHVMRNVTPFALDGVVPPEMISGGEHAPAPPAILHEQYGDRCDVWMLGQEAVRADVLKKAMTLVQRTLFRYLMDLPTLGHSDEALAKNLVEGLVQLIEHATADFVTELPVGGLRLGVDQLDLGAIRIRRLTGDEIGSLAEFGTHSRPRARERRAFRTFNRLTTERCLITARDSWDKAQEPRSFRMDRFVLAMQLLGFDPCGVGFTETHTSPGPTALRGGGRVPLVPFVLPGEWRDFGASDLEEAVTLSAEIPDEVFEGPRSRKGIALYRFRAAAPEIFPGDALLEFVTALEALLLGGVRDELSFRFRLFGAWYLAGDSAERKEIHEQLKVIYELRSRLVHGLEKPPTQEQLVSARTNARQITGRMLTKALRAKSWPKQEELVDLVLS